MERNGEREGERGGGGGAEGGLELPYLRSGRHFSGLIFSWEHNSFLKMQSPSRLPHYTNLASSGCVGAKLASLVAWCSKPSLLPVPESLPKTGSRAKAPHGLETCSV